MLNESVANNVQIFVLAAFVYMLNKSSSMDGYYSMKITKTKQNNTLLVL